MASNVLTQPLAEPLNGVTVARVDIYAGYGNLIIDCLPGDEPLLAGGSLQYLSRQDAPTQSVRHSDGSAELSLRASKITIPRLRLPWQGMFGSTEWQIHLNPAVALDLSAASDGGNVSLDLAAMSVRRVSVEAGGGNLHLRLPERAADLSVSAKSGGGNVSIDMGKATTGSSMISAESGAGKIIVRIPEGIAARVTLTTGMGKVIVDPRYTKVSQNTFQSADYAQSANRVEVTIKSGMGDVSAVAV